MTLYSYTRGTNTIVVSILGLFLKLSQAQHGSILEADVADGTDVLLLVVIVCSSFENKWIVAKGGHSCFLMSYYKRLKLT